MIIIAILIVLGILFLVAELLIIPGHTIGGILSLACYGCAVYQAFDDYGTLAGIIVLAIVIVLSLVAVVLSLRSNTWQKLSLNQTIASTTSDEPIEAKVAVGTHGKTMSRLSPMGKVEIDGAIYEAKSLDAYIDPKTEIEVVGYENFNVIVSKIN